MISKLCRICLYIDILFLANYNSTFHFHHLKKKSNSEFIETSYWHILRAINDKRTMVVRKECKISFKNHNFHRMKGNSPNVRVNLGNFDSKEFQTIFSFFWSTHYVNWYSNLIVTNSFRNFIALSFDESKGCIIF